MLQALLEHYNVLVGAYLSDGAGSERGRASLYLGAPISDLDNTADERINGGIVIVTILLAIFPAVSRGASEGTSVSKERP